MARDPDDDEIACEILADHFVISANLHPDAKHSLAGAIRAAVLMWLEACADEYRNQGGA